MCYALLQGSMRISYDARNKMISTKQSLVVNGMPVNQLYIEDFKTVRVQNSLYFRDNQLSSYNAC